MDGNGRLDALLGTRGLVTRRRFLHTAASLPLLAACTPGAVATTPPAAGGTVGGPSAAPAVQTPAGPSVAADVPVLTPTPACGDDDDPTPAQTEGPYFRASSPRRASLVEAGIPGTRLVVTGQVLSTSCQPVARALLDFWQCDAAGMYDNVGFRLRGHQFADDQGRYRLETIVPGLYPGRTRHIHVKVQAPNRSVLTTQLYFPGEPQNARDGIYNRALELEGYQDAAGGKAGRFDFVLAV